MAKNNTTNNVVIRVTDKTKEKMIKYYEDKKRDKAQLVRAYGS